MNHTQIRQLSYLFIFLIISIGVRSQQVIPLYRDSVPNSIGKLSENDIPTLTIFLPSKEKATGTSVIIFPGGAYFFHAFEQEGIAIAKSFASRGIASFVVKYRLPLDSLMRDKSMAPLQDAQQAIKLVRDNAKQWNLDSTKVGVIGYSAGGHVASTLGTHFTVSYIPNRGKQNLRPDFMILVYPVITMEYPLAHAYSRFCLIGKLDSAKKKLIEPSKDLVSFFSSEQNVTPATPPTYLTQAGDDEEVNVNNSIIFYQALVKNKVPAEMHLFPNGNHGFTQRLPEDEWLQPMLVWMKKGGWLTNSPIRSFDTKEPLHSIKCSHLYSGKVALEKPGVKGSNTT